jgi:23S rRNA (uridine2552-2'-O)-methyltransferase
VPSKNINKHSIFILQGVKIIFFAVKKFCRFLCTSRRYMLRLRQMTRQGQEDYHYHRARREGFAARSVYKLAELDRRYHLLRPGFYVLDLGCHPGSWLQYCAARVGEEGRVLGVDLKPVLLPLPPQVQVRQADLLTLNGDELRLPGGNYDIVMSDAAPRTTGLAHADAACGAELAAAALNLARLLLKPGGNFVAKVFWSQEAAPVLKNMKPLFARAKASKPAASASASRETYLVGLGLKTKS